MGKRVWVTVVGLILLCGLAACSSEPGSAGGKPEETSAEPVQQAADEGVCTAEATRLVPPYSEGFPPDWPFPPDTVVYNAENRADTGVIVTAVSSTAFQEILDFMNDDVVSAGFEIERGETEENDAEAEWKSTDYSGRWAIRKSATCDGETVIQVFAAQE